MPHLVLLNHYCDGKIVETIYNNEKRKIGIISNLSILNENKKCIGKVVLLQDDVKKKILLDSIVEFNKDKISWRSSTIINDEGFYLVDSYWVKNYSPTPKIDVPVKVYDPKTKSISVEMENLSFSQFMNRRLLEETGKYQHIVIAAYENFKYLFRKSEDYYFSLNSTIKHYHIDQTSLISIISFIDNTKKKITAEWNKYLGVSITKDQTVKMVNNLYKKSKKKQASNVVPLMKNSLIP